MAAPLPCPWGSPAGRPSSACQPCRSCRAAPAAARPLSCRAGQAMRGRCTLVRRMVTTSSMRQWRRGGLATHSLRCQECTLCLLAPACA